jgi:hypothetical protein
MGQYQAGSVEFIGNYIGLDGSTQITESMAVYQPRPIPATKFIMCSSYYILLKDGV